MLKKTTAGLIILFIAITTLQSTQPESMYDAYMPLVYSPPMWIGIETEHELATRFFAGGNIKASIRWSDVEQIRGDYDWFYSDRKIGTLPDVKLYGSIKMSPTWANGGQPVCKLPQAQYWPDFVDFAAAAIDRYGFEFVGIWNEPDALPTNPVHWNYYGCIGDGTRYGEFFSYVYQHLKPVYPDITFVIGDTMGYNIPFTEDMMVAVGDDYDAVGFHCYAQWYSHHLATDCAERIAYFDALTDKPILLTETGIMCYGNCGSLAYEDAQVTHFRSMVYDPRLHSVYWYTLGCNDWMETDMVDNCTRPRKVWYTYGELVQ